jgi:predicted metal-dependent hydrolase
MEKLSIGSLEVELHRKAIKHLYISVLPPFGVVRISAPKKMPETAVHMAVLHRIPWVRRQQNQLLAHPRQSPREMLSGESLYLWGKRYLLSVVFRSGKHEIKLDKNHLYLFVNPDTNIKNKRAVLEALYRSELLHALDEYITKWQSVVNVKADFFGIKKMKTKWGSCNTEKKRIWLNLELAKKPVQCFEYVLLHELVHLLERHHNQKFYDYMSRFMPNWKLYKNQLNAEPLILET